MTVEPFRIPNRVFIILVVLVTVATGAVVWWVYPLLPAKIPSHFGLSGRPDAWVVRSWWSVGMPWLIELGILAIMAIVYHYPQYTNLPTTIALTLLPEKAKGEVFWVIRHMMVIVAAITSLLMAYLTLAIIGTAEGTMTGVSGWAMGGFLAWILLTVIVYTAWMVRLTNRFKASLPPTS